MYKLCDEFCDQTLQIILNPIKKLCKYKILENKNPEIPLQNQYGTKLFHKVSCI